MVTNNDAPTDAEIGEALKVNKAMAGRRCFGSSALFDDLVGAGHLGIMQSMKTFSRTKGKTFAAHAANTITRNQRREIGLHYSPVYLPHSILDYPEKRLPFTTAGTSLAVIEFMMGNEPPDDKPYEELQYALGLLPNAEREILEWYFFQKKTLKQIGELRGIHWETVRARIKEALAMMKQLLT